MDPDVLESARRALYAPDATEQDVRRYRIERARAERARAERDGAARAQVTSSKPADLTSRGIRAKSPTRSVAAGRPRITDRIAVRAVVVTVAWCAVCAGSGAAVVGGQRAGEQSGPHPALSPPVQTADLVVAYQQTVADRRAPSIFARAASPADTLPDQLADGYRSPRQLVSLPGGRLFAAVAGSGQLCLLAVPARGAAASTCTAEAAFRRRGITLALPPVGVPPVAHLAGARWSPDGVVTYWTRVSSGSERSG